MIAHRGQQAAYGYAVQARTDDESSIGGSVQSRPGRVAAGGNNGAAGMRVQDEGQLISREAMPAGQPQQLVRLELGDTEPGDGRADTKRRIGRARRLRPQQTAEGFRGREARPGDLRNERPPGRLHGCGDQHSMLIDER